jgi:hypothetical protein
MEEDENILYFKKNHAPDFSSIVVDDPLQDLLDEFSEMEDSAFDKEKDVKSVSKFTPINGLPPAKKVSLKAPAKSVAIYQQLQNILKLQEKSSFFLDEIISQVPKKDPSLK